MPPVQVAVGAVVPGPGTLTISYAPDDGGEPMEGPRWIWWNFVMSGILTVFLFARLWRRANVLTDMELTELRYGGRPAAAGSGPRVCTKSV